MNKKFQKIIALSLVFSMAFINISFAEEKTSVRKSETVYVTIDGDEIKDETVSVWLNSDKNINIKDKTDLNSIKNLKTDKEISKENGYLNWNENEKDVYYQGKTDKKLPVDLIVKYYLDDKEIKNSELEGKSGHLKIVISSKNNRYETGVINGKTTDIYSPYTVVTAMIFSDEKVDDIKSDDVKVIKDGKNQIVTSILTPGLKQNFDNILKDKDLKFFKDEISLEMEIKNYKPIEIYSIITNEFFQEKENIDSLDKLQNGVKQLEDNSQKLVDASIKLAEGQERLNSGISKMQTGVEKLYSGSEKLTTSTKEIAGKFDSLESKVGVIQKYIFEMYQGSEKLFNGINDYTEAVGKVSENTVKIKNGATQLSKGSGDLDSGVDKLKNATSKLKKGTEKLDELSAQKDELLKKSSQLSQGLNNLGGSYGKLLSAVDEISKKSVQLKDSTKTFNEKLHQVESLTKNFKVEMSLESDAKKLEDKAESIQNVIDELAKKNKDDGLSNEITTLNNTKAELLGEVKVLRAKQSGLAKLNQLGQSITELANGSDMLLKGNVDLSDALSKVSSKMNESKSQLENASLELNKGLGKVGESLKGNDLTILKASISQLDGAAGQIKSGTEKLKSGTEQNENAMGMLNSALAKLDENSNSLKDGSGKINKGLEEFKKQSSMLSSLSQIKEKAIIPFSNAINLINDGLSKLDSSTGQLKEGSDKLASSQKEFSSKLGEFKQKGIDELGNKTKDLESFKNIIDIMFDMAKQDSSFTGTDDNFETKHRIIEKIK